MVQTLRKYLHLLRPIMTLIDVADLMQVPLYRRRPEISVSNT